MSLAVPVYVNWRLWSPSRRVVVCTPVPQLPWAPGAKERKTFCGLVTDKSEEWKRRDPIANDAAATTTTVPFAFLCFCFLAALQFPYDHFILSFSAGTFSRCSCAAAVVVVFSALVGWFRLGFSSSFFSVCLWWGGEEILLRDYQFTWHSPFVLCVCVLSPNSPIPYVLFFFPLHSLGAHHADIIFLFDSSSSPPSWFRFVSFLSLTQDLNLLPAVRETGKEIFSF